MRIFIICHYPANILTQSRPIKPRIQSAHLPRPVARRRSRYYYTAVSECGKPEKNSTAVVDGFPRVCLPGPAGCVRDKRVYYIFYGPDMPYNVYTIYSFFPADNILYPKCTYRFLSGGCDGGDDGRFTSSVAYNINNNSTV